METRLPLDRCISDPGGATISVVIPAFNEAKNIRTVIESIIDGMAAGVADYEVIIIDDGSTDETPLIIRELTGRFEKVRGVFQGKNGGKGAALLAGFKQASMEWILFTDADLQISIAELPLFLGHIRQNDILFGYRNKRGDSLLRRLNSKIYALLIRILFGVRLKDINCPFKLFRHTLLDACLPESSGFFIDTELACLALDKGFRIKELAVTGYRRQHGVSSVRLRHVFETFREVLFFLQRRCRVKHGR